MHVEKLFNELCAAGLPVVGVSINGEITWGIENPSSDQLRAADIIVAAHDDVDHAHERRRRLASDTMGMIMDSRLCRTIIEGGDLSGYRLPEVVAVRLNELRAYYVKNAFVSGDYLNGLEGGDQVGTTGRTKTQVISFVTFAAQLGDFLDSVALSADDRRSIMEQFRATS